MQDPLDDTLVVPETTLNRITWIDGDGRSAFPLRHLGGDAPGGDDQLPNGLQRLDHAGRSYLLASYRSGSAGAGAGHLSLWDVTAVDPALVWTFPPDGALDTPHAPVLRERGGRWWLLWAHTHGSAAGGTVGVAWTDDPTVVPAYVADLVAPAPAAPLVYLRGVELTDDGALYLTDGGSLGGIGGTEPRGRLLRAPLPEGLAPTGASGDAHQDQVFVDLESAEILREALDNPFEGWLWDGGFTGR
ncbi:MAG: hypothetical protein R3F59_37095 [Myxococcota bacterium]